MRLSIRQFWEITAGNKKHSFVSTSVISRNQYFLTFLFYKVIFIRTFNLRIVISVFISEGPFHLRVWQVISVKNKNSVLGLEATSLHLK